jgi:hypothetical protein
VKLGDHAAATAWQPNAGAAGCGTHQFRSSSLAGVRGLTEVTLASPKR